MSAKITPHALAPKGALVELPNVGILLATGAGAPGATVGTTGFAKGALYIDTANGAVYQNTGTAAAATWTPRGQGAQGAALTAADASTVDATYGTPEADVINNLRVRVGEIEAALEAAGIVAAN